MPEDLLPQKNYFPQPNFYVMVMLIHELIITYTILHIGIVDRGKRHMASRLLLRMTMIIVIVDIGFFFSPQVWFTAPTFFFFLYYMNLSLYHVLLYELLAAVLSLTLNRFVSVVK